jgi:phenylalanyl-tRNA synthetase alpha subunit
MKLIHILYAIPVITILLSSQTNCLTAEISFGELVDKITILTIKTKNITDPEKLKNVYTELKSLQDSYNQYIGDHDDVVQLQAELQKINKMLWDIEDAIRIKERNQEFDDEFIALARGVYTTNDKRCALKKKIDLLLGSRITEEKSYEEHMLKT